VSTLCPDCGYDLTGLNVQCCPECGTGTDWLARRHVWQRLSSRRWRWFMLAPLISLPGVLLAGIGQPILSFGLSTIFAYRALKFDDEIDHRPGSDLGRVCQALMLSFNWVLFSTGVLVIVVAALGLLISLTVR
jgi:hypothetical protein